MEATMKLSKRILSVFLAIVMVLAVASFVGAVNIAFTDVSGHWAWTGGQIPYLVDKEVLNGYKQSNGTYTFMPDGEVTRAEFIKMLDETFGLTATTAINYSDVSASEWFYPYFAKAAAQGYLLNYGTSVSPNGKITREEAFSLLVRYLDLPANEKASSSEFADYSSISDNYRDYILRATYAGLTNGYAESDGAVTFRPQRTLTRAEALTILYRAAGCIFNTNAYSRDSGAYSTNNVITRGGVILNGITLTGRVIISEGASSGTVSLSGCTIADTLYIRGTADVNLDNCKVENIVITNGCKLSLLNGTEVKNITVYGKSTLGIYSGITVDVLNVEYGAANTSVTGDGAILMAYINASGFSSSMVPAEFQIGSNLTASFASSQYQGSSSAQDSFSMTPFVTSDDSNYYLNLFPTVDGKVYYYFTNGATAPNTSSFDSYYASSSFTGVINVSKNVVTTEKTFAASSVKNFEYVVLQLQDDGRKYAPVIIPNTNTTGTGFSTAPYLADETTIKFTASVAGTLYWYYAESGEKITQAEFVTRYASKESALCGAETVISGRTLSLGLNTKYLANYDYIVMMLKTATGSYYTPVVVSAGDNGFAKVPELTTVGTVSFKSNVTGTLYYYYSKTSDLPAAADFKAEYNRATYADSLSVTKSKSSTFDYKTKYSEEYPYLIIALKDSDGNYMQPVALCIDYRTGFVSEPEVIDETTIRFKTEDDGEVMYYYTKTEKAPTIEDFKSAYAGAATKYKDTVSVTDSYKRITYSQSYAVNYPYMAFMYVDDQDVAYTPVVLALDASADTGFTIAPYVNNDTVFFKTEDDGEVWYYFSKDGSAVASSEFEDYYNDVSSSYLYGWVSVSSGKINYFEIDDDVNTSKYPYLVIAFLAEDDDNGNSGRKFHFPVVLDLESASTSGAGLKVSYVGKDEVVVLTSIEGTVRWYFTDAYSNPGTKFETKYNSAGILNKDYEYCKTGNEISIDVGDTTYRYVVICIATEGPSGTDIYLTPIVVDLQNRTSDSEDTNDGATTSKTGLTVNLTDPHNHIMEFTPDYSGEVTISLDAGSYKGSISSYSVSAGQTYEFDYDMLVDNNLIDIMSGGSTVYLCLQLVTNNETYSIVRVSIVE